jgi:MFS family permease
MADDPLVGPRPLMVSGSVVMAAAAAASASASSLELLLLTRLAFGAGSALCVAGTSTMIASITHHIPAFRARLMGVQTTMVNLGVSSWRWARAKWP